MTCGIDPENVCGIDPLVDCGVDPLAECGVDPEAVCGVDPEADCGVDPLAVCGVDPEADCGTGISSEFTADDPLVSETLVATQVFGGIQVSWNYPSTDGQRLSHAILYRSKTNDPAHRNRLNSRVTGNTYFDDLSGSSGETYYYWAHFISVAGRQSALIGPASAVTQSSAEQMLTILQGEILESSLNQTLRTTLDTIAGHETTLLADALDRQSGDMNNTSLIQSIQAALGSTDAQIINETAARISGDTAITADLDAVAITINGNTAAITDEATARANADSAIAQQQTLLQTDVDGVVSSINTERTARSDADSALASTVTTLQTDFDGHTVTLQSEQTIHNDLSGQYTVRIDNDGYVTGFGLYNDGVESTFGVRADRFVVGATTATAVKPFIVENGETIMDTAVIKAGTITRSQINQAAVTNSNIKDFAATGITHLMGQGYYRLSATDWATIDTLAFTGVGYTSTPSVGVPTALLIYYEHFPYNTEGDSEPGYAMYDFRVLFNGNVLQDHHYLSAGAIGAAGYWYDPDSLGGIHYGEHYQIHAICVPLPGATNTITLQARRPDAYRYIAMNSDPLITETSDYDVILHQIFMRVLELKK